MIGMLKCLVVKYTDVCNLFWNHTPREKRIDGQDGYMFMKQYSKMVMLRRI